MIKYKTTSDDDYAIEEVVGSATTHIRGADAMLRFHDTWEKANQYLIDRATARAQAANRAIELLCDRSDPEAVEKAIKAAEDAITTTVRELLIKYRFSELNMVATWDTVTLTEEDGNPRCTGFEVKLHTETL